MVWGEVGASSWPPRQLAGLRGQAVISDCWGRGGRMEDGGGEEEGKDKSPLIKVMRAKQGLVQNLNHLIIQPWRKRAGAVCLRAVRSDICSAWAALPSAGMRAALWVTFDKMNSHCVITAWTSSGPLLMSGLTASGESHWDQMC